LGSDEFRPRFLLESGLQNQNQEWSPYRFIGQDSAMKLQPAQFVSFLCCVAMLQGVPAVAEDFDARFSLSAGVDITSGTYGGDDDIEDTYIPLTATVDYGRVSFRLTVPYLSVRSPEGTILDPDGVPLPGTGEVTTKSGLGDVVGRATIYDVIYSERLGFAMDLTGKIKLGTADEAKGLGTGESDYSVHANFYKFVDRLTLMSSVGYKFRGDPADIDLRNVLMASVGGTYKFAGNVNGGLFYDYSESAISGNDALREVTGLISHRISDDWRLQVYAMTGLTDSSPDWGAGVTVKRVLKR
jgi:hypothetical protein